MSSGPPQRRLSGQQSVQVQLHPQMSASLSAGLNRIANHFGLLDVPPPGSHLPSTRLASTSIDQQQCAGAHVVAAPDSLDTAIQPQRSGKGHSQGSARSRDAAAAAPSADRSGRSTSGAPENPTGSTPLALPIRPRAIPIVQSGDSRGKTFSPSQRNDVVPMGGVEASKLEGSATSDENMQPRLVPRKGAGPELRREGGGRIDEYLMRLLRNGSRPTTETSQGLRGGVRGSEMTTPSVPALPVPETGQQQWQGSRLGPLAPGAGVKSSSLNYQPVLPGSGPVTQSGGGRGPLANVAPTSARVSETDCDKGGVGFQSLASQPSTTAAETSQKPRSVQFGANRSAASEKGAIGAVPSPRGSGEEAARVMGGSSHQQAHGVREAVGADLWQHIQATIAEQSQEFQRQLLELHRIVHKQAQLQAGRSPMQSSGPHPPLFVGQRPTSMSQQQGTAGSAWWLNSMPWASLSSGGGAVSWQANSVNQGSGDANLSSQKSLAGSQQPSRTIRIAMDAQRTRRGSKWRATKSSGAKSLDNGPSKNGGQPPREATQPTTWFSVMSPYLQNQSQALAAQQNPVPPNGTPARFDPLSAWYHFHFGQRPGLNGNHPEQLKPAAYGSHLADLGPTIPERGWENNCKQYFNFSMPGTSDNNTGNTSARQQPSYAHNQAMSAPAGLLGRQQVQRQTARDRDHSGELLG